MSYHFYINRGSITDTITSIVGMVSGERDVNKYVLKKQHKLIYHYKQYIAQKQSIFYYIKNMEIECLSPYTPISTKTAIKKDFFIQSRKEDIKNVYFFHHRPIGRGGYGVVYQATLKQPPYSERCVKMINKKFIKNPQILKNEVNILRLLDHPHIVRLYETYEDEHHLYLVQDLCRGGQLFDRIDQFGCFSEEVARKLFIQIVKTVKYLHLQKICHRDIKAENFLFPNQQNDNIMLIDFGLSFQWKNDMRVQMEIIGANKIVGTSYYVSPQILQKNYDESCDIWALGILLHVISTASAPFTGDNDEEILDKIRHQQYSPNSHIQKLNPLLSNLIAKILVPSQQRITIDQILQHPWITHSTGISRIHLQLDFSKMKKFATFSRLKAVVLAFISSQLPFTQIKILSDLFKQIDTNNDGYLTVDEIQRTLKRQGIILGYSQLHSVLKKVDMDKNGKISFNEYIASMLTDDYCLKEDYIVYIFKYFDQDRNGKIGKEQLLHQIELMGLQLPNRVANQIMKQADLDKDGEISYEQFVLAIQR